MDSIISLLTAMLPIPVAAQSQPVASQGVPRAAIPPTTEVIVIQTPRQGVTAEQIVLGPLMLLRKLIGPDAR